MIARCKARVFAELDLTRDIDISLPEDASDFEKQQHQDEVYL